MNTRAAKINRVSVTWTSFSFSQSADGEGSCRDRSVSEIASSRVVRNLFYRKANNDGKRLET